MFGEAGLTGAPARGYFGVAPVVRREMWGARQMETYEGDSLVDTRSYDRLPAVWIRNSAVKGLPYGISDVEPILDWSRSTIIWRPSRHGSWTLRLAAYHLFRHAEGRDADGEHGRHGVLPAAGREGLLPGMGGQHAGRREPTDADSERDRRGEPGSGGRVRHGRDRYLEHQRRGDRKIPTVPCSRRRSGSRRTGVRRWST